MSSFFFFFFLPCSDGLTGRVPVQTEPRDFRPRQRVGALGRSAVAARPAAHTLLICTRSGAARTRFGLVALLFCCCLWCDARGVSGGCTCCSQRSPPRAPRQTHEPAADHRTGRSSQPGVQVLPKRRHCAAYFAVLGCRLVPCYNRGMTMYLMLGAMPSLVLVGLPLHISVKDLNTAAR